MTGTEGELLGRLLQGGAFAVLVFIIVWQTIRREPREKEAAEKKDALHAEVIQKSVTTFGEAVQKVVAECASVMREQMEQHRKMVELLLQQHQERSAAERKECREERKEWAENMKKEGLENRDLILREGELNRKSRTDFVNQIQRAMEQVLEEGKERRREAEGNHEKQSRPERG